MEVPPVKCVVKTHLECERVEARPCSFTKPQRDAGGKITGANGKTEGGPQEMVMGCFRCRWAYQKGFTKVQIYIFQSDR